jgi:hypothetical protein
VLVTLALVGPMLADAARLAGLQAVLARDGIWAAAILMPAGFFLSAAGRGTTQPNRFIVLVYAGMAALVTGASSGIGRATVRSPRRRWGVAYSPWRTPTSSRWRSRSAGSS